MAQPDQIIVTEDTYHLLKESFHCERVGEVKLKNKANPVLIYEVVE